MSTGMPHGTTRHDPANHYRTSRPDPSIYMFFYFLIFWMEVLSPLIFGRCCPDWACRQGASVAPSPKSAGMRLS